MKTILIATDFSPASQNAVQYGLKLSMEFNARLVLFNAYQQVPGPVTEIPAMVTSEEMHDLVTRQLDEAVRTFRVTDLQRIELTCAEGPAAATILIKAKEINADLILTGMKASGKGLKRAFGSTVTELARKTTIPMLVIPEESQYRPVKSIALANEKDLEMGENAGILNMFRHIAQAFHSKVYLVRVAPNEFKEAFEILERPFRLNRILGSLDPSYECVSGSDVSKALSKFVETYKVDMLAMIPHRHSFMARLFYKNATRSMVFETHIPLLILPESRQEKKGRRVRKEIAA